MAFMIRDDRGKRVPKVAGVRVDWRCGRDLKRAIKSREVVLSSTDRRQAIVSNTKWVLAFLAIMLAWRFAWTHGVIWAASFVTLSQANKIALVGVIDRFERTTGTAGLITVLVLYWLWIHIPPALFAMLPWPRLCGPSYVRHRLYLRHCPSCDYTLPADTIQPDGCTLCSECGAAWRIPAGAITTDANKNHP